MILYIVGPRENALDLIDDVYNPGDDYEGPESQGEGAAAPGLGYMGEEQ